MIKADKMHRQRAYVCVCVSCVNAYICFWQFFPFDNIPRLENMALHICICFDLFHFLSFGTCHCTFLHNYLLQMLFPMGMDTHFYDLINLWMCQTKNTSDILFCPYLLNQSVAVQYWSFVISTKFHENIRFYRPTKCSCSCISHVELDLSFKKKNQRVQEREVNK